MGSFWGGFEKEAKKFKANALLERIRRGLPIHTKGHSRKGLKSTRLGRTLMR